MFMQHRQDNQVSCTYDMNIAQFNTEMLLYRDVSELCLWEGTINTLTLWVLSILLYFWDIRKQTLDTL